jgi:hypothetical protein
MSKQRNASKILDISVCIFYTATVFLWFKNSFSLLKSIPVSHIVPFSGLCFTVFLKLLISIRTKRPRLRIRFSKSFFWLILIIILVLGLRLPYLINHAGLSDSDDAITMLMSKHISEGKLPPLYFYRQLYQGSLFAHLSALMNIIFGFSHLLIEITILSLYLAFVVVQFHFIKKLFSLTFAVLISFFYCLPLVQVLKFSFFVSSAYPLVLLLGSSILFLSYQIAYSDKTKRIGWLGFLMGLAFWTHQGTLAFIFTALIILFLKFRSRWKKYLTLGVYMAIGGLPLLMAEVLWNFPLVRYLIPGQGESPGQAVPILENTRNLILSLFSLSPNIFGSAVLFLLLLGVLFLLFPSFQAKRLHPRSIFSLFFLLFSAIYLISDFSQTTVVRYLYPLYFGLPILFLGSFWMIPHKIKYYMMALILVALPFGQGLKGISKDLSTVRSEHRMRMRTVRAMKKTGKRFWRGNFWSAYVITALSREELIVDSYSVNRYFPYQLAYDNQSKTENFIFITGKKRDEKRLALRFTKLLESCKVRYQKQDLGAFWLVYGIKTPIPPKALLAPIPTGLPTLETSRITYEDGFVGVNFSNVGHKQGSDIWLRADIPSYSMMMKRLPIARGQVGIRLPYPRQVTFPMQYSLSYKGIRLPQTLGKIICTPPEETNRERRHKIVFLSRIEPKIEMEGSKMQACTKDMKIEINGPLDDISTVRLYLYSPFNFSGFAWYGDHSQKVDVSLNDTPIQRSLLEDGHNVIEIPLEGQSIKDDANIISLHFRYHLFFRFAPLYRTAALLEKVELE